MNNDLVSRDAVKKTIDKFIGYLDEDMIYRIKVAIDKVPTVITDNYSMGYQDGIRKALDEKPQGKWIKDSVGNITCSNCGCAFGNKIVKLLYPFSFPYCPECGAKMRGEE